MSVIDNNCELIPINGRLKFILLTKKNHIRYDFSVVVNKSTMTALNL